MFQERTQTRYLLKASDLLIRYRPHHSARYDMSKCGKHCYRKRLHRQMRRPYFEADNSEGKYCREQGRVAPRQEVFWPR